MNRCCFPVFQDCHLVANSLQARAKLSSNVGWKISYNSIEKTYFVCFFTTQLILALRRTILFNNTFTEIFCLGSTPQPRPLTENLKKKNASLWSSKNNWETSQIISDLEWRHPRGEEPGLPVHLLHRLHPGEVLQEVTLKQIRNIRSIKKNPYDGKNSG